ncbi:unnamed protein product, partial [Vitis vinifera]
MGETVREVLYETRNHASRPYCSNYPPQQLNEGAKGSFLSLPRGLSQIKEKWSDYRRPKKLKRWVSLFVSLRGERVAVAAGNQITILQKDDNYQEPCGIFTSNSLGTFIYGAWSESHDVLGVCDDSETLYFIKGNGEEMARSTRAHLKVSSPIIGLIPQDDSDTRGSCLCSFNLLTSDGFLHNIEISQDPAVSISSFRTSSNGLTLKKQFPQHVFCLDYHVKLSLLIVVGSASSISITSSGTTGSHHLSLWRRSSSLDLEPVCSTQVEGLYSKPKGYIDNLSNEVGKFLNGIVDFTWWSDHTLVLAKRSGTVIMLDILSGIKLLGNDPVYSMPVLERVQQFQGQFFLLESTSSEEKHNISTHGETGDLHHIELVTEDRLNQADIARLQWSLISFSERSVPEMYNILISNTKYQAALEFAVRHGLDTDEVLKSQWLHSGQGINEINTLLSNIKDQDFVLSECVNKVGPTEDAVKALLAYGLHLTSRCRFSESDDHGNGQIWDFRKVRLQLLQFRDRLETFLGINMGRYDLSIDIRDGISFPLLWGFLLLYYHINSCIPISICFWNGYENNIKLINNFIVYFRSFYFIFFDEYEEFINFILLCPSLMLLNAFFTKRKCRHPYTLTPSMLEILAAVPETIPVQTYGQLLPGRSPPTSFALREEDWVECEKMVSFINRLPEDKDSSVRIRTEPIVRQILGFSWPSADELSSWYKNRARDIDTFSGQLDNCLCLIDFACRKGIGELQQFYEDITYLHQLIYSDGSDSEINFTMNLCAWEQLSDYEKFKMMLKGVKEENVVERLRDKAIPFMQNNSIFSVDYKKAESFLVRWLKEVALENKLDICLMVIEEGCKDFESTGIFKDEVEAAYCALQCLYLCTVTDRWSTMSAILSKLPHVQGKLCCKFVNLETMFFFLLYCKVATVCSVCYGDPLFKYISNQINITILGTGFCLLEHNGEYLCLTDTEKYFKGLEQRLKLAEGHIEAGRLLAYYQGLYGIFYSHLPLIKNIPFLELKGKKKKSTVGTVPKPLNFFVEAHSDEKGVKQILRLILSKFVRRQPSRSDNDWANMWRDMQYLQEKVFPFLDLEYMLTEFCRGLLKAGKFSLARNYLKGTGPVSLASEKAENLVIQAAREYFFSASSLACSEIWKAKECLKLFPGSRNVKAEADVIDALTVKLPELGVTLLPMQFRQIKDPMEIIKMAITSQAGAYLQVDELVEIAKLLGLNSQDDVSAVEEAIAREAAVAGDLQLAFDLCLSLAKKGHGPIWDLCAAIARGPALENMDINSRKQLLGFALSHCDEESIGELLHAWKDLDTQGQCETLMMSTGTNPPNFSIQDLPLENGTDWESLLRENGKILSFAALQLPWLLELSRKTEHGKKYIPSSIPGKQYISVRTEAILSILSWLARNGFAPRDDLIASLAKSIIEPPVTGDEDLMGCSFLLNLVDAFNGIEIIEEQLKTRLDYQEISSMMKVGMTYSLVHSSGVECEGPAQRRELLLRKFQEKHMSHSLDEIDKLDKVQSTFWREWKLKLEEQKRLADHSRVLEKIIPGVETARFLSGDFAYIKSVVLSLIESVKLEKKHILKDVLKLADTYGLNHTEMLLRFLNSVLISEVWSEDDIIAEFSEVKGEMLACAVEAIKIISLIIYPAIDGSNKPRLAYIYSLLSDCYLKLEEIKQPLPVIHSEPVQASTIGLAHFYKVVEQECRRVSFIKNLNFKNIAVLGGLNIKCFKSEVLNHIDEHSLEALAKMVQNLVNMYTNPMPEGLISWQDVYKHHVLSLLMALEARAKTDNHIENPENLQSLISELEQNYDSCRLYIRVLGHSDSLDIMKRYFTVIIPLKGYSEGLPDNSTWQDCLIVLLNFWIKLTDDMMETVSHETSREKLEFDPESLTKCLKVFIRLVMEESVSPSQGWNTVLGYVNYGLVGGSAVEVFFFCRAMVFSGCRFGAIAEVFSEAALKCNLEDLTRVRHAVWERIVMFSDNLELPSHVRVYALELMQFISGGNIKGFSAELKSNILPWEDWHELHFTSKSSETTTNQGLPDHADTSSRFTSTLVALKSSQLVAAISSSIEITPDDLLTVDAAVSRFSRLCGAATTDPHIDALLAVLGEWEGLFVIERDFETSPEAHDTGNNWSSEDWDEGWESFQEEEPAEKEKNKESSFSVHPLHACWMEIFKKLIMQSRFSDLLKLIDRSLTKSNGMLLDEDDAQSLTQTVLGVDCFVALKMVLLLPYEAMQLQCANSVEEKLKQGGISDTIGRDHELLLLILSSGIISNIITQSSYGTTFSYLCYLVGNFSRQYQEAQRICKFQPNQPEIFVNPANNLGNSNKIVPKYFFC